MSRQICPRQLSNITALLVVGVVMSCLVQTRFTKEVVALSNVWKGDNAGIFLKMLHLNKEHVPNIKRLSNLCTDATNSSVVFLLLWTVTDIRQ